MFGDPVGRAVVLALGISTGCGGVRPQVAEVPEWPRSTLAEQGADAGPIAPFIGRARGGDFGNVDRIVVVRNGHLVIDETIERDYREISRGASGDHIDHTRNGACSACSAFANTTTCDRAGRWHRLHAD